jgi:hypothetical protein
VGFLLSEIDMRIGTIGEKQDLLIRQGATFGPVRAKMTNPDGTAMNLTGCIIRGQVRDEPLGSAVVCDVDVTITDPVNGDYEYGISAAKTAAMSAGAQLRDKLSQKFWDLELEDTLTRVTPLYYGDVSVFREVTRA